jgi:hypothetical protein
MTARSDRKPDRDLLLGLLDALSVSRNNMRRDPCGDWTIVGRRGHILTDAASIYAYVSAGTARRWTSAKRALSFMVVSQDGDDEGILKMDGMPSPDQAAALRKVLGLRKSAPLTPERREALRQVGRPFVFIVAKTPISRAIIDLPEVSATHPASQPQTAPARADAS